MAVPKKALLLTLVVAGGLLLVPACGDDKSSGTNPVAPTVSAPKMNETTDMLFIGQTVTFTATGTGVTWGGDAPTVATVDANTGAVTGVGNGRVTIWAQNAGGRTTRLLRVMPSYNGTWSGSYTVTGCQSSGDFTAVAFCSNVSIGQVLNMGFQITHNRDQVTGSFSLGDLQGTLSSGVVNEDGSLPLNGTIVSDIITIQLQNLRATSPSAGTMKGQFDQVWGATGYTGTGRLSCDIRDVTRTSGAPVFFSRPSGIPVLTLEDAIRAVVQR